MNIYGISNSLGQTVSKYDVNKKLRDAGIPEDIIQKGQSAIEQYAYEHHINLPSSEELKKAEDDNKPVGLKEKDPNKGNFEFELVSRGIPLSEVKQGKEAVEKYASSRNIQLPPQQQLGSRLSLVA